MIIVVTGGRDFTDNDLVIETFDALHLDPKRDMLYWGGAKGADTLANNYCSRRGIRSKRFAADWGFWGHAAGPKRNEEMLREAVASVGHAETLVVAFPGGRGTAHCVRAANTLGLAVLAVGRPANTTVKPTLQVELPLQEAE